MKVHRLGLVLLTITFIQSFVDGASCNANQQQICLHAVVQRRLSWLSAGGECFSKQYVQFTHLCIVYNYLPKIDYCCCALMSSPTSPTMSSEDAKSRRKKNDMSTTNRSHANDLDLTGEVHLYEDDDDAIPEAALCCRYHQTWNRFRCLESEDAVRTSSEPTMQPFFDRFIIWDLSVVSLILGLVSILVSCVVCCFKFWRCRKSVKGGEADVANANISMGLDSDFKTKTKIDLLDSLEPPPYMKSESSNMRAYSLQYRQQPSSPTKASSSPNSENNFTIDDRQLHHLYHIFSASKPAAELLPPPCERGVVMTTRNSVERRSNADKRCCSDDLDDHNFSSLSCSSDSLRSDVTSDTDCDKLKRYSFYRRRILSSDTRLSPSFPNFSSRSRRPKNSFPRFYRHHQHHHHRSHQLQHPVSMETTRFLSNGQISMSEEERLKFLERVLKRQISESLEKNQAERISAALTCLGSEDEGTNEG